MKKEIIYTDAPADIEESLERAIIIPNFPIEPGVPLKVIKWRVSLNGCNNDFYEGEFIMPGNAQRMDIEAEAKHHAFSYVDLHWEEIQFNPA